MQRTEPWLPGAGWGGLHYQKAAGEDSGAMGQLCLSAVAVPDSAFVTTQD